MYRVDYHSVHPHSALDYRTPEAFGLIARNQVLPSAGPAAALFEGGLQTPPSLLDHHPDPNQIQVQ